MNFHVPDLDEIKKARDQRSQFRLNACQMLMDLSQDIAQMVTNSSTLTSKEKLRMVDLRNNIHGKINVMHETEKKDIVKTKETMKELKNQKIRFNRAEVKVLEEMSEQGSKPVTSFLNRKKEDDERAKYKKYMEKKQAELATKIAKERKRQEMLHRKQAKAKAAEEAKRKVQLIEANTLPPEPTKEPTPEQEAISDVDMDDMVEIPDLPEAPQPKDPTPPPKEPTPPPREPTPPPKEPTPPPKEPTPPPKEPTPPPKEPTPPPKEPTPPPKEPTPSPEKQLPPVEPPKSKSSSPDLAPVETRAQEPKPQKRKKNAPFGVPHVNKGIFADSRPGRLPQRHRTTSRRRKAATELPGGRLPKMETKTTLSSQARALRRMEKLKLSESLSNVFIPGAVESPASRPKHTYAKKTSSAPSFMRPRRGSSDKQSAEQSEDSGLSEAQKRRKKKGSRKRISNSR